MTPSEAIEEVVFLKGLFPKITQTEQEYWLDKLERYDQPAVRIAITRYADKRNDAVDRVALLELIAVESRRAAGPTCNPQLDRVRCDEHWAQIDAAIAALPPPDRERLTARAVESLPRPMRQAVTNRGRDPLDSRIVKSLIYAALQTEPAHE